MCRFFTCEFKKVFVHQGGASFCADTLPQQFQMLCHKRNKRFNIILVGKHLSYYDLVSKEIADQLEGIGDSGAGNQGAAIGKLYKSACCKPKLFRIINCTSRRKRRRIIKKRE